MLLLVTDFNTNAGKTQIKTVIFCHVNQKSCSIYTPALIVHLEVKLRLNDEIMTLPSDQGLIISKITTGFTG